MINRIKNQEAIEDAGVERAIFEPLKMSDTRAEQWRGSRESALDRHYESLEKE